MKKFTEIGKAILIFAVLLRLCSTGFETVSLLIGITGLLTVVVSSLIGKE